MATDLALPRATPTLRLSRATPTSERAWVKWTLIAVAVLFLAGTLVLPLVTVFFQAFLKGPGLVLATFADPDGVAAIRLTLLVAVIAVPANLIFGICAAWSIVKFDFRGKSFSHHADRPAVLGVASRVGHDLRDPFRRQQRSVALPPFDQPADHLRGAGDRAGDDLRDLPVRGARADPLMQDQGSGEEEAAISLGASGWQTFWRVTLPNIRWGLLYGVLLCNARAMGEFGAVSVISGHIRGVTNTIPLHIEILYDSYDFAGAFAMASLLALLALVTLVAKTFLEWRYADELAGGTRRH